MKEPDQPVSDPQLGLLLRDSRPAPALPPRFQQSVWRRIEDSEAPPKMSSWLDVIANLILQPRFAAVAAAIILLAGIFVGVLEGRQIVRHDAQMNYLASVMPHAIR